MINFGAAGNFIYLEFFRRLRIIGVFKARLILVEELLGKDLEGSIEIKLGFLTMAV